MNKSFAANLNSGSESESSTAAAISGGSQRPHLPQINSGSNYHKGSHLVAASGNLVLENEKILKLFPKCRPRSQNESMNQFYASIKDQHQPPTSSPTAQFAVGGPLLNTSSKPYSSSSTNATMKKIITDNQMMALGNANSMAFNSNSSSSSLCGGGGGGGGAKMHPMANKMEKTSTTNPFLTHHSATSESQQREDQAHAMEGGGGGGRRLTHSQSDFGLSYADQHQQQMSGSLGATSGPSLPLSTSSSSLSTEMMSKNFQRHMKNPLNSYQSNPFIGVGNKIDEYEEELNIIVQDQQTAPPEYYFDRRTVRPVDHMQHPHKPPGHSYGPVRSTPMGNILHSPTVERQDYNHRMMGCPQDRDHHQQQQQEQQHYLNVGCSPVNSNNGTVAYNEVADERMQKSGPDTSVSSLDGFNRNKHDPEKPQESNKSSTNFTSNTKKRNKSVAVVSEGEVVIFDDVEDSWYNLKTKPESIGEGHVYKQNFIADPESVSPERCAMEEQERTAPTTTATERGGASVAGMVIGKF